MLGWHVQSPVGLVIVAARAVSAVAAVIVIVATRSSSTHDPTDDFGQRIQMRVGQLADLVADVRKGVLDEVLVSAG